MGRRSGLIGMFCAKMIYTCIFFLFINAFLELILEVIACVGHNSLMLRNISIKSCRVVDQVR